MSLETERLVLDCFEASDAAFIVELLNTEGFLRHIGDRGVRTEADAAEYLRGPSIAKEDSTLGLMRVRRKDGPVVGMCGLLDRDGLDDVDLGFAFLPEFWGRGLAREAARACLEHAFGPLGLARVVAITSRDNAASGRLLEAVGMRREGEITLGDDEGPLLLYVRDRPDAK